MKRELVFLTEEFYEDHAQPEYKEIEHKVDRPYMILLVKIEGTVWGLPFRSHIKHAHAFWTDKESGCGIDYSKAVVVSDPKYIDRERTPHIRPKEFEAIRGQEQRIHQGFLSYIKAYKRARRSGHPRYGRMIRYSTLQNYEDLLFPQD